MSKIIYLDEERFIKEFNEKSTAYVDGSSDSSQNDMGSAINKAKTNNPTDKNFIVNTSSFDGQTDNNPITIDVNATNGQDAKNQINKMVSSNPQLKNMQSNGKLMANVHMESKVYSKKDIQEQKRNYMKEHSQIYTKKELKKHFLS